MTTREQMNPALREHFVYRAFDAAGDLLYVGCSLRPEVRRAEHKSSSRWYPLAVKSTMQGPFNYDTARQLEREAIQTEHPLWNHNEPRRFRAQALRTRVHTRWFHHFMAGTDHWPDACDMATEHTESVIPAGWVADGLPVSEFTLARVVRAERADAELLAARRSA